MDVIDEWSDAAGKLRDAIVHRRSMQGQPGYALADRDFRKALADYEEVTQRMLDEIDA